MIIRLWWHSISCSWKNKYQTKWNHEKETVELQHNEIAKNVRRIGNLAISLLSANLCCWYLSACAIIGSECMFSKEQHECPCKNYKSTGILIPLLSSTIPIDDNVEHTSEEKFKMVKIEKWKLKQMKYVDVDHSHLFPYSRIPHEWPPGINFRNMQWNLPKYHERSKCWSNQMNLNAVLHSRCRITNSLMINYSQDIQMARSFVCLVRLQNHSW